VCAYISLYTTVVQNIAQSSSDYLPSYPADKLQSSDAVYWRLSVRVLNSLYEGPCYSMSFQNILNC